MLIRVGGGKDGIKEYLEKGHKQGRELDRDQLDERVILMGDLELTDQIINGMETNGERYLHITLAFKEDDIPYEVLMNIVRDFKDFAFAAFDADEVNFYAEAHLPKTKSYVNQKTGDLVERKPHIHIVVPKVSMLSGGFLNPLGMVEHNERFIDAFQEHVNNKYGLASPKDNRRVSFTDASDMIQRYKADNFEGPGRDLKRGILEAVLERDITSHSDFLTLIAEFGQTRTRNVGKDHEYQNVKPEGYGKGVNLKDHVFSRSFIEMSGDDKRAALAVEIQRKYETEGVARRDPAGVEAALADWHRHRAKEIKYLNSGNEKQYQRYRVAGPDERASMLVDEAKRFYDKHRERHNEPARFRQNPFEHTYGYKQPTRPIGREPDDPDPHGGSDGAPGGARGVPGRGNGDGRDGGAGEPSRATSGHDGHGRAGATHEHEAQSTEPTSARGATATGWQHDAYATARGQAAGTINGVRTLSSFDVAGNTRRPQMLLQDHARVQLDDPGAGRADAVRRDRDRERVNQTGRASDTTISQLARDHAQRQAAGAAGGLEEFREIKAKLDAGRLLAGLSASHGIIVDKYGVDVAPDGSYRIQCGNRKLNVADFLTKEMRLPWDYSAAILREAYADQIALQPAPSARGAPSRTLWRQFQLQRKGQGGQRHLLTQQIASERARRAALRATLERDRATAHKLPTAQRKAALSIAHATFTSAESALRDAASAERQQFRAPIAEQYRRFLQERAAAGDGGSLAELRRMSSGAGGRVPDGGGAQAVGSIGAGASREEANAIFYHSKGVKYRVHLNGEVVYSIAGRAIIQDKGSRLLMLHTDRLAIETALRLAHAKFGEVLTVSGPKDFQQSAAKIAGEIGIEVTFQDRGLEEIRQRRVSQLVSDSARRDAHRQLGRGFSAGAARQATRTKDIVARKPGEREINDKGPER